MNVKAQLKVEILRHLYLFAYDGRINKVLSFH